MRFITFWISGAVLAVLVLCRPPLHAEADGLSYRKLTINGVTAHIITVDLNDPSLLLTPGVALDTPDNRKTFTQFLKDSAPLAQITGTFFDLKSGEPIGDVVVRGSQVCFTRGIGTALVVTPDNTPAMVDTLPGTGWRGFESVLQGGLRLVRDGQIAVDPEGQGFHDRYMQRNTARIVVGILPHKQVIMAETGHLLLPQLADAMLQLGCVDAMALDGGGSVGIAFDGTTIMSTQRKLANVLMVVRRPPEETAQRIEAIRLREEQQRQAVEEQHRPMWEIRMPRPDFGAMWNGIGNGWFGLTTACARSWNHVSLHCSAIVNWFHNWVRADSRPPEPRRG